MENDKKNDFNFYANNYDKHRIADLQLLEIIVADLNINSNSLILDFGCGTGNYLNALQKRGYHNLFGLDQSDDMCKIASEKTKLNIIKGSHLNIPFENEYLDAIMMIDVIHFVKDIKTLLSEFYRISKTQGRILIATQSYKQLETRIYSKYFPSTTSIDKLRHYEISDILSSSEYCGLSVVSVKDYMNNTNFLVDQNYLNLIKSKSFYVLRLIPDEEFQEGIEKLEFILRSGNFIDVFPGRTIITLEKK